MSEKKNTVKRLREILIGARSDVNGVHNVAYSVGDTASMSITHPVSEGLTKLIDELPLILEKPKKAAPKKAAAKKKRPEVFVLNGKRIMITRVQTETAPPDVDIFIYRGAKGLHSIRKHRHGETTSALFSRVALDNWLARVTKTKE